MKTNFLVFTDLDGTLLDHDDYSYDEALPAIKRLSTHNIPLILTTSKTRAEIEKLQESLSLRYPFIVENGAAVFIPKDYFELAPADTWEQGRYLIKSFALPRNEWQRVIANVPKDIQSLFKSFAQLGDEGVAKATGLSLENATLANNRDFSEPLLWEGCADGKKALIDWMTRQSIQVVEGGRFIHLSTGYSKGVAMKWLTECFENQLGKKHQTIALGDSSNDISMLEAADYSVVIKRHDGTHLSLSKSDQLMFSRHQGPKGWNETMSELITEIKNN